MAASIGSATIVFKKDYCSIVNLASFHSVGSFDTALSVMHDSNIATVNLSSWKSANTMIVSCWLKSGVGFFGEGEDIISICLGSLVVAVGSVE